MIGIERFGRTEVPFPELPAERMELPDDSGEKLEPVEFPDDSGETPDRFELPDDSGETPDGFELPDDSNETPNGFEIPDDFGEQPPESRGEQQLESVEQTVQEYYEDLKEKSPCPETLPEKLPDADAYERISPEENAQKREEFTEKRTELKRAWEKANDRPWPKYETDIYSQNGKLIRQAGSDYDAHHIQPLCMGGKNEAANITPMHAADHYDKQGVHAPDSPYSKLEQQLGGNAV